MSKIKVILFTLLLMFVLAVPALALDSTDQISFYYVSINDGYPIYCTGDYPQGMGNFSVGSIWVYIPFTAAESYTINFNLLTGPVNSYGSWVCDFGYLNGRTWGAYGSLSDRMTIVNGPQYDFSDELYQVGRRITLDTSGITPGDNWYLRVGCAYADFTLHTSYMDNIGYTSTGTVYWTSALGFYITASGMTAFSSTGTSSGDNYVKATKQTNGYISSHSALTSPVHVASQTIYGSKMSGLRVSAFLTSSDAEAVSQLKQVNTTLDGMAANLQTITDDFKARENAGNEIGGTATDQDVSAGTSGLSNGNSSISSGIAGLPSFADVMSPAVGYISFLTAPVQLMFNFGNGYLLYIATAMVILSVIFFIIRRMGGGSGD